MQRSRLEARRDGERIADIHVRLHIHLRCGGDESERRFEIRAEYLKGFRPRQTAHGAYKEMVWRRRDASGELKVDISMY